jgi:predicted NAD-dependent protein-ADP-ribosyltransferase YbiA (DUF1768 family)
MPAMPPLQPILALRLETVQLDVVPFYFPGSPDLWHARLSSGPLGNFWPSPLTVSLGGVSGTFSTSEAAYQAMKWWENPDARREFEAAKDGEEAFQLKLRWEAKEPPGRGWSEVASLDAEGGQRVVAVDKWTAMIVVLEAKFSEPSLRTALLSTGSALLIEHNPATGRDAFWSDDRDGSGANHLGRALMFLRRRLAQETGGGGGGDGDGDDDGAAAWPAGLDPRADVESEEWRALMQRVCSEVNAAESSGPAAAAASNNTSKL